MHIVYSTSVIPMLQLALLVHFWKYCNSLNKATHSLRLTKVFYCIILFTCDTVLNVWLLVISSPDLATFSAALLADFDISLVISPVFFTHSCFCNSSVPYKYTPNIFKQSSNVNVDDFYGFILTMIPRGVGVLSGKVGTEMCRPDRVPFQPFKFCNGPFFKFENWFTYILHFW